MRNGRKKNLVRMYFERREDLAVFVETLMPGFSRTCSEAKQEGIGVLLHHRDFSRGTDDELVLVGALVRYAQQRGVEIVFGEGSSGKSPATAVHDEVIRGSSLNRVPC